MKSKQEKRTEIFFGIRCTPSELKKITDAIKQSRLMKVEWIRQALLAKAEQGNSENDRLSSASEAVRAGLRLLDEGEVKLAKLAALRRAIEEGDNSSNTEHSLNELIKELDKESSI
jgi:antitoxin ParD1/3/4